MKYLENVPYLEMNDFTSDMSLKPYVGKGKPVVVMAQGLFCGYCTQAKPAFQKFADQMKGKVVAATIQIDGNKSEKMLGQMIDKLDKSYRGVPTYLGFNSHGKYVGTHNGGRGTKDLLHFASQLK